MNFLHDYRDIDRARTIAAAAASRSKHSWKIMDASGSHAANLIKFGLDKIISERINIVYGPGSPLCMAPVEVIDKAISAASENHLTVAAAEEMTLVPGSRHNLKSMKYTGCDIETVASAVEALQLAEKEPQKKIIFLNAGFENDAAVTACVLQIAEERELKNFTVLCSHLRYSAGLSEVMRKKRLEIHGIIANGDVSAVTGTAGLKRIASDYRIPVVISGSEPVDMVHAIYLLIMQLEEGGCDVVNQYSRCVKEEGNKKAAEAIDKVYAVTDMNWRGIGRLPASGYSLKQDFGRYDAEKVFKLKYTLPEESIFCIAGKIHTGTKRPEECTAFGKLCTFEHPIGAPMALPDGACAAVYNFLSRKKNN